MIGATVMPHNLYLHSSLVQSRAIADTVTAKKEACRFNLIDSTVALNAAFLVNAAILVMAAADFHSRGILVTEIQQAHSLLDGVLGSRLAPIAFAVALLAAGQSSTITGTLSGQIVMEGFLNLRMRPWMRRLVTRGLALIPATIVIALSGDHGLYRLLILSQVVLSLQLPFATIPLIHFTSDPGKMGVFANHAWVKIVAWTIAADRCCLRHGGANTTRRHTPPSWLPAGRRATSISGQPPTLSRACSWAAAPVSRESPVRWRFLGPSFWEAVAYHPCQTDEWWGPLSWPEPSAVDPSR